MCAYAAYIWYSHDPALVFHSAISIFQLAFEGVYMNGYAGDIAIDDLTLSTSCPKPGKKPI